jgi:hypothetical protein
LYLLKDFAGFVSDLYAVRQVDFPVFLHARRYHLPSFTQSAPMGLFLAGKDGSLFIECDHVVVEIEKVSRHNLPNARGATELRHFTQVKRFWRVSKCSLSAYTWGRQQFGAP